MKVSIGPYKNWWGVYKTIDLLQKVGVNEDRCEKIAGWICDHTPAEDFFNLIYKLRGDRKVKVHIDNYDTWSMDNTLAYIILPMLKQLKETKQGSPMVDDEDVPEHMRHDGDNWVHYKWEWVLNEMIWAFEQELDDSWEEKFTHGTPVFDWYKWEENDDYKVMEQKNPDYWVDTDGLKEYNNRIDNGFRLFGKYYRGLWD